MLDLTSKFGPFNFSEDARSPMNMDSWRGLQNAWASYKIARMNQNKDKMFQAIIDIRAYQSDIESKITPLSEFEVTQEELQEWLISDPKRTGKMLHDYLVSTMNKEINEISKQIREKYRKKIDEYRGNNRGKK